MSEDGFMKLRQTCVCGCTTGRVTRIANNDVVRCADCDKFAFNAGRSERGLPAEPRRPIAIKSKFSGFCKACGARHEPGDEVWWVPKTKGVWCVRCHASGAVR